MAEIEHTSPVPLYYQLKQLLQAQIQQGILQPGDQIPTEAELCAQYNISRTPVRQALLEMTREGLLTRTVGRGTFVAPKAEQVTTLQVTVPDTRWQWPLAEATRRYNENQERVRIELAFQTVPLNELHDYLSLAVAQGQAPDISVLDSVWVAEFAHRRYLRPLGELDPAWARTLRDLLYPPLLHANSYQGQQYAVPTNADATVLWYRRDWFEAEKLSPPQSWSELLAVGQHFRQPEVRARYGLRLHPLTFAGGRAAGETTTYQVLPFLWSNSADVISADEVVLNSEAACEALTFLTELVQVEQLAGPTVTQQRWDDSWRAFARGDAALAFGGTYENFLIQSEAGWSEAMFVERVGFVPLPAGPRGKQASLVGGMTYGIYRQSRRSAEALELLKLALSPAILQPFSVQTGQNPALMSVAQAAPLTKNDFLQRTTELFARAGSRPSLPVYDLVSAQFQEMVELCLTGQMPVEKAVRRAAERIGGITNLPLN